MPSRHGNGSLSLGNDPAFRRSPSGSSRFRPRRNDINYAAAWPSLLLPSIPFASDILCAIRADPPSRIHRDSRFLSARSVPRESPTRPPVTARSRSLRLHPRKSTRGYRAFSDPFESDDLANAPFAHVSVYGIGIKSKESSSFHCL